MQVLWKVLIFHAFNEQNLDSSLYENLPEHANANGARAVAANILRKEPEQETFVRLKISPSGIYSFFLSLVVGQVLF